MIKKLLIILLIFVVSTTTFAQSVLSETQKLASTAKVWGFLKYYHPNVAKGKFNWDEQLFTILPKVEKANSKEELSAVFSDWLDALGQVKVCKSCDNRDATKDFDKNFDLSWTQDSNKFSNILYQKLKFIEKNRFQGKQRYVKQHKRVKKIIVQNEPVYEDFNWENKNLRLLSLFRYWNTVEYFFPYKYQTDQKWNDVLTEMIPKFLNPKSELDYHLAMLELVVKIDDSHAGLRSDLLDKHFGNKHIPAIYRIIDNKAVIVRAYNDSLTQLNDLKVGDAITKVNGKTIMEVFDEKEIYIQGSNTSAKLAFAWNKIFNGTTDSVEIEFLRNDELRTKNIGRYPFGEFDYKRPLKKKWKILENNIGFVDMGEVEREDVTEMMDSLMHTKSIVFDIRNYPKGTMYHIANYLNSTPKEFVRITEPDLSYPGKFKWKRALRCGGQGRVKEHYKGKIILLVNSRTISHAEFNTMAFQTYENVTTIGSQTLAADGNVSAIGFVGEFKTRFSGIGIFYPDGTETQRVGVKVDIEIKPTVEGIQEGRDEVLEKALTLLNN